VRVDSVAGMTQTFDQGTRTEAPIRADELTALRGFLDYHRDTFRWKCAGLTQEQLAQAHPPSTMTLGGMMKHLALNEVGWFGGTLLGEADPPPFDAVDWDADPDWEWRTARDDSPEDLRALAHVLGPRSLQPALDPAAHDRGVRPPQRPGRPDP
jgi:Protein of unknown function (DUF664)